jgi:hypothetical protein
MSSSKNVAIALAHIQKRRKLESSIAELEDRIFVLESSYFEETGAFNIIRGWDGFKRAPLSIKKQGGSTRACDRILSLSSLTSPCGELPWPKESEFLGASKAPVHTDKKTAKKPQQHSAKKALASSQNVGAHHQTVTPNDSTSQQHSAKKAFASSQNVGLNHQSVIGIDSMSVASSPYRKVAEQVASPKVYPTHTKQEVSTLDEIVSLAAQTGKVELPPGFKASHRRGEGKAAILKMIEERLLQRSQSLGALTSTH